MCAILKEKYLRRKFLKSAEKETKEVRLTMQNEPKKASADQLLRRPAVLTPEIKQRRRRRWALLLSCGAAVALLLILLVCGCFDALIGTVVGWFGREEAARQIDFYEPDYETDIFTYEPWLALDRTVYFHDGGQTLPLDQIDNLEEMNPAALLFYRAFQALTAGDAAALRELFAPEAPARKNLPETFTMQKVYDISVEWIDAQKITEKGHPYEGRILYSYKVNYAILRNDGTYRKDMGSDERVPHIVQLVGGEDSVQFYQILSIRYR